ncbi:TPA: hypothetical protein QDC20_005346 [Burkholderia aenigmatica]|uniref:hypothetical protein n=1 Tax=Burkholderia sp. AU45251 TaxID=3059204 RepID=UPI00264AEF6E|nr:hypothetical protein [Burkholderia sp. AU45251]HDR9483718.1 hypothetical protein [Burkholderia aenigmatica]MDN7514658.1 hypothetical protein [Burkholderia sp. AU45251]HDR9515264.1 hypothetical protein [Burkholderia aenigmatica]HDR9592349.1 hypothetical protein [Burkholderia aenigmatica]HDR9600478.1 hypothetical protein [Burkholderia aenigmatica]
MGNSSRGNGSPAFFERARSMLSLFFGFGFDIGIAAASDGAQQKVTEKSIRPGSHDATSVYSNANF